MHLSKNDDAGFRCVILGSYRRHFADIVQAKREFESRGISVLYPIETKCTGKRDGFVFLDGQLDLDPRAVELDFLHLLKACSKRGFAYFVNPDGLLGRSAAYELGVAQSLGVPCFFSTKVADLPAYIPPQAIRSAEELADFIVANVGLPKVRARRNERGMYGQWRDLLAPNAVVAAGGIIAHERRRGPPDILLVRTHKWHDKFSVVGGKVKRGERVRQAYAREIKEETGLDARVGHHLCTFDQIRRSGYYDPATTHLFVDFVAHAPHRRVTLNYEAQEFVWMPADAALRDLPLEPNARKTIRLYASLQAA